MHTNNCVDAHACTCDETWSVYKMWVIVHQKCYMCSLNIEVQNHHTQLLLVLPISFLLVFFF